MNTDIFFLKKRGEIKTKYPLPKVAFLFLIAFKNMFSLQHLHNVNLFKIIVAADSKIFITLGFQVIY